MCRIVSFVLVVIVFLQLQGCKSITLSKAELMDQTGRYAAAAEAYNELYRRTPRKRIELRSYLSYKAGVNYARMGNTPRALNSFNTALYVGYPDSILLLNVAQQLQRLGKRKEAAGYYRQYLDLYPNDFWGRVGLEGVELADSLMHSPTVYTVTMAKSLNSAYGDFAATYAPTGDILYFTTSRPSPGTPVVPSEVTNLSPNNLYMIKRDVSGKWSKPDSVGGGINTPEDEGTPSISSDGSTLYYSFAEQSSVYDRTVQIYRASKSSEGGWSPGQRLPVWSDTLRMAAHPSLDASNGYLYFVSEGGVGGKDIYRIRLGEGGLGTPENLGVEINTLGDELFPTMVGDSTLYFSSNGRPGLGGLDLYRADMQSDGSWSVRHLGVPLNSPQDDYAITFSPTPGRGLQEEGYLSSTRGDVRGRPHLYAFSRPAVILRIDGFVMDREGYGIPQATVRVADERGLLSTPIVSTRDDGSFVLEVQAGTHYVLHASHPQYLNQYLPVTTDSIEESRDYEVDFYLASRVTPEQVKDIYYDFDRATLRPESHRSLDELVVMLAQNPDVRIELSSHTDRKGGDPYNERLSQRRAEAAVDYLISKGVAPERLKPQGYGKRRPFVVTPLIAQLYPWLPEGQVLDAEWISGLDEEQQMVCDQLNRRTEFVVIPPQSE